MKKFRMFERGDRVALALSGGKDSFVLLDVMHVLHDPSKLVGISVVEGIPGYNRSEDVDRLRKYALERGVDLVVTSIEELTGYTLSEIVERAARAGLRVSPCTFCGTLRRRAINCMARQLGVDKVATAHNLDDEAQTALMNILRGDLVRLFRQHPLSPSFSELFVRRVKPLRRVYEWENAMYALLKGFRFQEVECPYITSRPTMRAKVREWAYELEERSPGALLRIMDLVDRLAEALKDELRGLPRLPTCGRCGEPTAHGRSVCKVCELLESAGIRVLGES